MSPKLLIRAVEIAMVLASFSLGVSWAQATLNSDKPREAKTHLSAKFLLHDAHQAARVIHPSLAGESRPHNGHVPTSKIGRKMSGPSH